MPEATDWSSIIYVNINETDPKPVFCIQDDSRQSASVYDTVCPACVDVRLNLNPLPILFFRSIEQTGQLLA